MLFSLHPAKQELRFITRFSGELFAKRLVNDQTAPKSEIRIYLPTLSGGGLQKLSGGLESKTKELKEDIASILAIPPGEVLRIAPFDFGKDSLIVQVDSSVDLAKLKPEPKEFVSGSP